MFVVSTLAAYAFVIDHPAKPRVVIYSGTDDYIVPPVGTEISLARINSSAVSASLAAPRYQWAINNDTSASTDPLYNDKIHAGAARTEMPQEGGTSSPKREGGLSSRAAEPHRARSPTLRLLADGGHVWLPGARQGACFLPSVSLFSLLFSFFSLALLTILGTTGQPRGTAIAAAAGAHHVPAVLSRGGAARERILRAWRSPHVCGAHLWLRLEHNGAEPHRVQRGVRPRARAIPPAGQGRAIAPTENVLHKRSGNSSRQSEDPSRRFLIRLCLFLVIAVRLPCC